MDLFWHEIHKCYELECTENSYVDIQNMVLDGNVYLNKSKVLFIEEGIFIILYCDMFVFFYYFSFSLYMHGYKRMDTEISTMKN